MHKFNQEEKKILFDIFQRSFNRDVKTYYDFAYIVQHYVFGNGKRDSRLKDSQAYFKTNDVAGSKVLNTLLNVLSNEDKKYDFKNLAPATKEVVSFLADALIDTYGPAIPVNLYGKATNFLDMDGMLSAELVKRGFSKVSVRSGIFVKYDAADTPTVSEDDQEFVEKQYLLCKQMFVDNFATVLTFRPSRDSFENYMRAVRFMFSNLEARMSPKTMQKPTVAEAKSEVENFFNETSRFFAGRNVRGYRNGEYFQEVNTISRKLQTNAGTEQEKQVFQDFLERCVTLHKALNFVGEDGKTYPANYFLVMPMTPHMFFNLLTQVQKVPGLTDEQKSFLARVKSETRMTFPSMDPVINGQYRDFDDAFDKRYKGMKVQNGQNVLDLTDEENFKNFKEQVRQVMEEYELPNTKICLYTIANQMAAGREPLNFGFVSQENAEKVEKTESEKTETTKPQTTEKLPAKENQKVK